MAGARHGARFGAAAMSMPRCVLPGKRYLLTRRTTRRYFLFRPDGDRTMEEIFWYCLAVAAAKHGVVVHSAISMSNHVHLVVTDVLGVLPDFLADFHRWLACATKAHRGWPAEVFDKSQTSAVELVTPVAVVREMAYVIANAPLSGLVRYAHEWPGAMTRVADVGRRVVRAKRPEAWFDAESESVQWPEEIALSIEMPEVLVRAHGSAEAARGVIGREVERRERSAWDEAQKKGRGFLGAERAVRVAITDRGSKWELFGARNPTFAAGGDSEAARGAVERLRGFRGGHRESLVRWRGGERDVVFPAGTWWMRVHHRARCDGAPQARAPD